MPRPSYPAPSPAFAGLSFLTVALGVAIFLLNDVPASLAFRNPVAWLVGGIAALFLIPTGPRTLTNVLVGAPIGLALCLLSPGQEGVHRWVGFRDMMVNVGLLVLPAVVVALAAQREKASTWGWTIIILCLLVALPDASQTIALTAAMAVVVGREDWPRLTKLVTFVILLLACVAAALQPDPLGPVREAERVWALARDFPALAVAGVLALLAVAASPIFAVRKADPGVQTVGLALAAYMLVTILAPFVGAYPVPLAGIGSSPIIGFWLGMGLLGALLRASR